MRLGTLGRRIGIGALAAGLSAGSAHAATNSYTVRNHPDGAAVVDTDYDGTGYILRLDIGGTTHTFNANQPGTNVVFHLDVAGNMATMKGVVSHNQSGGDGVAADALDDTYLLDVVFKNPLLTDPDAPSWFSPNPSTAVYDGAVDDLLADANVPNTAAETSNIFTPAGAARIQFAEYDLILTGLDDQGDGFQYTGALVWDEFMSGFVDDMMHMPFFLQYRWRLTTGEFADPSFDLIGGAGWLETNPGALQQGNNNDLLFVLTPIPAPAALPAGLALLGLVAARRHRRGA